MANSVRGCPCSCIWSYAGDFVQCRRESRGSIALGHRSDHLSIFVDNMNVSGELNARVLTERCEVRVERRSVA